ncbi:SdrD B-like domain-containing protein, partial [Paracoccaceae bacterium GXU_MW_L88]
MGQIHSNYTNDYLAKILDATGEAWFRSNFGAEAFTKLIAWQTSTGYVSDTDSDETEIIRARAMADETADAEPTGAITGRFFVDKNGNNQDDDGGAVVGATVQLWSYNHDDKEWQVIQEAVTDANGDYIFTGLPDNEDYRVRFINNTGQDFVTSDVGSTETDSDISQVLRDDGQINYVKVRNGSTTENIDAGVKDGDIGAISGRIFVDQNDNNVDDGDGGLAGLKMQLWKYDNGWKVVQETTTDADGNYSFDGLPDHDDYRVRVINDTGRDPVRSSQGGDERFDSDIDQRVSNGWQINYVKVENGAETRDIDMGFKSTAMNALGAEYDDLKVRELGEELIVNGDFEGHQYRNLPFYRYDDGGVEGWKAAGYASQIEVQTIDMKTGQKLNNSVVELDVNAWELGGIKQVVNVTEAGTYQMSFDYGLRDIRDSAWYSDSYTNMFGVRVDGELVQLVGAGTKNGEPLPDFMNRTFDLQLSKGTHTIEFIETGWAEGTHFADDGAGALIDNVSLRKVEMVHDTGVVTGTLYYDGDLDGRQDDNEGGIGGRIVYLLKENGTCVWVDGERVYTETDANGNYSFEGVAPGKYKIGFTEATEYSDKNRLKDTSDSIEIKAGKELSGIDNGFEGKIIDKTIEICENDTFVEDFDTTCEIISEDVYFMVAEDPICANIGRNANDTPDKDGVWNNGGPTAFTHYVWLKEAVDYDVTVTVRLTTDPSEVAPKDGLDYAPDGFAYLTNQSNENGAPRYETIDVVIKAGQVRSEAFYVGTESARFNYVFGLEVDSIYNNDLDEECSKVKRIVTTPIALDLNRDGEIGVTGETSSADKSGIKTLGETVLFDMDGDGKAERIEWFDGSGDGILIDTRPGIANQKMTGLRLFGDEDGKYTDGYDKLRTLFDKDGDGIIKGAELNGLSLWVDNGDAKVERGEIVSLSSKGITEISGNVTTERDADGRELIRSTVQQDFEETGEVTYRLEGPDAALFKVDANGKVTFREAPDYENPKDHGKDNVYNVTLIRETDDPTCAPQRENLRIEVCDKPSLGDTVWYDTNGNGKLDTGEQGASGVKVLLMSADGKTVLDTTTTDANGKYLFDDLDAGDYQVMFVAPSGYVFTTESPAGPEAANNDSDAGDNGLSGVVRLSEGEHQRNVDAGLIVEDPHTASLGDTVWYDTNADGVLNGSESGAAGVSVELLVDGEVVATTLTDANGKYLFDGLAAGDYQVRFTTPDGYEFTEASTVAADAVNSDSDANV